MKAKNVFLMLGMAVGCMVLASCGHNDGNTGAMASPPPPATLELDTAAVLAIVRTQTSETTYPLQVDYGAVAVTPVGDETSSPISVDGT
jgi:hypothetical protein